MTINQTEAVILAKFTGPTLEEALRAVAGWSELSKARAAQLASAVRQTMKIQASNAGLDHGPVRFTCAALNLTLWRRAPACFGIPSKVAFHNIVACCRVVLMGMGELDQKSELTPSWQGLYDLLTRERQLGLIRLMRYCSGRATAPSEVTNATLDEFEVWCTTRQLKHEIGSLVRRSASNWNWASANVPGWPNVLLFRPNMRDDFTLRIEEYLPSLQQDVQAFLDNLAADAVQQLLTGGLYASDGIMIRARPEPSKPRTIQGHRDQIRAALAALVLSGVPIASITNLSDLVMPPARVDMIVDFHYRRRKAHEKLEKFKTRPSGLINICETLRQIAKFHCRLADHHVAKIAAIKKVLTPKAQWQMSEKNLTRVRALLEPDNYVRMLHLPQYLLGRAEAIRANARTEAKDPKLPAPAEAARMVMYAVALDILLFCPFRRHNLIELDLNKDLVRSGPRQTISHIIVVGAKTKTGGMIDWEVPDETAAFIDVWLKNYRPVIAEADNTFVFPGLGVASRNIAEFATFLGTLVQKQVGVEFNMHLARHFSVVRFLRQHPGQYIMASQLLGHRNEEMTKQFYSAFEADAAAMQANKLLKEERAETKIAAALAFGGRRRKSGAPE